jgi:hypothetical protein
MSILPASNITRSNEQAMTAPEKATPRVITAIPKKIGSYP